MTRRVLTNFRARDFKAEAAEVEAAPVPEPAPKPESNEVPTGTSAEIAEWAGDDKDRAQRALDTENENPQPRKGLVKQLEAVLADDGEGDE